MRPDIARYARVHHPSNPTGLSRRTFLETSAAGAAFVLSFHLGGTASAQEPPKEKKVPNPFDAWIKIGADGAVTLTLAKSEMGQGAMTALPMILAEELDVDWSRVKVEQALSNPAVYDHGTGGSGSVKDSYTPLRQAGAAARAMLVGAAADRLKVDAAACKTDKGTVIGPSGQRVAYGDLVADAAKRPLPDFKTIPLKDEKTFRIIGTNVPRVDMPSKVDGSARYGLDVRVPGMLYAVIARCPTFGGKAVRFDEAKAKAVPGVKHIVQIPALGAEGAFAPGGVAVVAESTWAATQGRAALNVEWDHGPNKGESSATLRAQMDQLTSSPGTVCRNEGDCDSALKAAVKKIDAVYELPFVAHACMEPMNATVHVRADGAEAWLPGQDSAWPGGVIAQVAGLKPEQVTVHTTLLGGGFGRKFHADFAAEAAQVSKAVQAPVQVVWTRDDDIQHDFYRPMSFHRLAGAVDASGKPSVWHHRMSSTSINAQWSPKEKPEASEIGGAVNLPYAIPNLRMEYAVAKTGVPVMWWRSVEHSMTAFANECFLDELAHLGGQDPLKYRLALLATPRKVKFPEDSGSVLDTERLKGVLELAASQAGWGKALPPGRGRGIACHFSFDSYAAEVAEVSVEKGKIVVHRLVMAIDCGRAILPDGVAAQLEGAVAYALSAAIKGGGAITIKEGRCEQSNFHDFEVIRLPEMPAVEVHIVKSDFPPTGVGEPGLPPVAPAVMNAVFAATGKRLRRLPVKAADLA